MCSCVKFVKTAALKWQPQRRSIMSECELASSTAYLDRKSTRLNSSHLGISYAVFCLKKKKKNKYLRKKASYNVECCYTTELTAKEQEQKQDHAVITTYRAVYRTYKVHTTVLSYRALT